MKTNFAQDKSILISETDHGAIQVSYSVIQTIIKQVTLDTPGVAEREFNFVTRLLSKKTGTSVIQDYINDVLEVEVSIKVHYGTNIPAVCKEVQKLIAFQLSQLLDLEKVVVNIRVDGLIIDNNMLKPSLK